MSNRNRRMVRRAKRVPVLGVIAALALLGGATGCGDDEDRPPAWTVGEVQDWVDQGVLAEVQAPYGPVKILRLQGTHYEMGYQYGYLMADGVESIWNTIFGPLIGEEFEMDPELATDLFSTLMDQAWGHVEPHTSQDFLDELEGVRAGAADAGHPDPDFIVDVLRRVMMLVDVSQAEEFGGDVGTMSRFFTNGYSSGFAEHFGLAEAGVDRELRDQRLATDGRFVPGFVQERLMARFAIPACSFFAAWGDRTADGRQIASRVLDFDADIGLGDFALITVFVPEGARAYVTIGYVGMLSTFAGMSERGIALSAVGASSAVDRLETQSISMKGREALEHSEDLDDALEVLTGTVDDGRVRAPSVGTVAMLAYGDPDGGGANAEAAASEFNGLYASLYRHGPAPACDQAAFLYEFDQAGQLAATYNHVDHPEYANLEQDAYEIDQSGEIRTFEVDQNQEFVYDATTGELIDDPAGEPYPVGYRLPCAVYRADPALNRMVRLHQTAANGPARDSDNILMHRAGAYRTRYMPHYDGLLALQQGTRYEWEQTEVFPDNGGESVPVGVQQAQALVGVVAMDRANTFSVIYDTTNLVLWVAYESGRGDDWVRAADNEYLELRLSDLLPDKR